MRLAASTVVASAVVALALPAAIPAATPVSLPKCPSVRLVKSLLKLKITKLTSYSSLVQYPYGSDPRLPRHVHQRTCVYATSGKYVGNVVPTTISFAGAITRHDFDASRGAAKVSLKPFTVPHLGDEAWAVNPPKYDPRAGASLFVLEGDTDIVISAPRSASNRQLIALARRLL